MLLLKVDHLPKNEYKIIIIRLGKMRCTYAKRASHLTTQKNHMVPVARESDVAPTTSSLLRSGSVRVLVHECASPRYLWRHEHDICGYWVGNPVSCKFNFGPGANSSCKFLCLELPRRTSTTCVHPTRQITIVTSIYGSSCKHTILTTRS